MSILQRNCQFLLGSLTTISVIGMTYLFEYSNNILRESSIDAYNHLHNDDKVHCGVFSINDINKLKEANGIITTTIITTTITTTIATTITTIITIITTTTTTTTTTIRLCDNR